MGGRQTCGLPFLRSNRAAMTVVYDLWFTREYEDRENTELHIGIYGSRADAEAAIAILKDKPGFRDYPEGFELHETELARTGGNTGSP